MQHYLIAVALSTHTGPVHKFLHDHLGLSQGAGTSLIMAVILIVIAAAVIAGLRSIVRNAF